MKEYIHNNHNEYKLDGKWYVEQIKVCSCEEKHFNNYTLYCKIHQRGGHIYAYYSNGGYITKFGCNTKTLYLSDEAKETVDKAIAEFEEEINDNDRWHSIKVACRDSSSFSLGYRQRSNVELRYRYVFRDKNGIVSATLTDDFRDLLYIAAAEFRDKKDEIVWGCKKTLDENPVYRAAIEQNDKAFASILKLYYRIADEDECAYLSNLLGYRILPPLAQEYSKDYVVTGDVDYVLLRHSGYRILHRPYFAMMGYTHNNITLDPHCKDGLDAAPEDAPAIEFEEFLKLFDEKPIV